MKNKNFLCQTLSNIAIITLLAVLFFVCNPFSVVKTAFAPYYYGERDSGKVALMFNVYEGSEYVEKILSITEKYSVTCTFFVGGTWVEKNKELLEKMSECAEIGNHGYLHKDHKSLSEQRNKEEIMLCHNLVEKITGIKMNLFAPPSGSYGDNTLNVCKTNGYSVIMWSKDTIDWRDKDENVILKRATSDTQSGDLILMHPTEATVKALPKIIEYFQNANIELSIVSDVIREKSV